MNDYTQLTFKPQKWSISFEKINLIFPNIAEIHFCNYYNCDTITCENFLKWIKNYKFEFRQIKFLYYDYKNDQIFKMPSQYIIDEMNKNGWEYKPLKDIISDGKIIGKQIKIRKKQ